MNTRPNPPAALSAASRRQLGELHMALLRLHKVLLDDERAVYEREHGRIGGTKMLDLVINDPQFAWLRRISELIVEVDEITESELPGAEDEAKAVLTHIRSLLVPDQSGNEFQKRYDDALQRQPDAVLIHGQVISILSHGE